MRTLVIGATGFVGRALCRRLLEAGHEVVALTRAAARAAPLQALGARVAEGNIADPNSVAQAAQGCDWVFHCAHESSHRAPKGAFDWINVAGTENVVAAARSAGVQRLVVVSCADATLLNRPRINWKETQALGQQPFDACSRSLLLSEELALNASDGQLEVVAVRPPLLWGPGEHSLMPALCREAQGGRVALFGSGDNLLSTLHVENLVEALILAASAAEAPGRCYHVADGEVHTAAEFLGQLCEALGLPPPRRGVYFLSYLAAELREALRLPGPWRRDVIQRGRGLLLDCTGAAQDLGYEPVISAEEGLRELQQWARSQGGPKALCKLARQPADAADVEIHAKTAAEHS